MLHTLSPENLENAAAHILQSNMQNFWEFRALARQVGLPISVQYLLSVLG